MKPTPVGASTTPEKIAEALRNDVVSGRFPSGTRLKIQNLSSRYGTSPMPVREALRQLEGERLVEISAHKGATVRLVTVKFIRDLYGVREALEGLLVEECAANASAKEVAELRALQGAWEGAAEAGDTTALLNANRRLHERVGQIGENDEARVLLTGGWPLIHAFRQRIGFGSVRLAEIRTQHAALIDAIAARAPAEARAASQMHCRSARDDLLRQLEIAATVTLKRRRG